VNTAEQLLRLPAEADLQQLGPGGRDFQNPVSKQLPQLLEAVLSQSDASQRSFFPEVDWNAGRVETRTTKDYRLYQLGRRVDVRGERYGRPELLVSLSDSLIGISNTNGEPVGALAYAAATSDLTNNLFNRVTVRGGLLMLETASEIVAFDLYRGFTPDRDPVLWRYSLIGAAPETTFNSAEFSQPNAALGIKLMRRQTPNALPATVGPITPACQVVQSGTTILGLDLLTGKRLWVLEGYDNKEVRLAAEGLEVAIVNPAEGKVQVIDCRDGKTLREREYRGDWNHWFAYQAMMVDFRQDADSGMVELRVWNALTGETVKQLKVDSFSRAAECEQRYFVILQPSNQMLYVDLKTLVINETEAPVDADLNSIALERFQDRLVVIVESVKARLRQPMRPPLELPVNGSLYAIDIESGGLLWEKPGKVLNMAMPRSQPRNSPFMALYRFSEGNGPGTAAVALVDLRDGRLQFVDAPLMVRARGFNMQLFPLNQKLELAIGDRNYEVSFTGEERAPQPVVTYGGELRRTPARGPVIFPPD
jgi:hypothetical protein